MMDVLYTTCLTIDFADEAKQSWASRTFQKFRYLRSDGQENWVAPPFDKSQQFKDNTPSLVKTLIGLNLNSSLLMQEMREHSTHVKSRSGVDHGDDMRLEFQNSISIWPSTTQVRIGNNNHVLQFSRRNLKSTEEGILTFIFHRKMFIFFGDFNRLGSDVPKACIPP